MSVVNTIKSPIKEELKLFNERFSKSVKSDVFLLNVVTKYLIKKKGKQMRPIFVFLTANMLGETQNATYNGAMLIELMHTATLVHDDVVDDSNQRRGFFSINALWKNKIAVLLGDYLLSKGLLIAVRNKNYELLDIVSKAVEQMSEGELLQIEKARKLNITEPIYYDIIRKKTAVLLAACAAVGAKSVNASEEDIQNMWLLGEKVGMAFQIKDDLFDFEPKNKTGKPAGNDLQEKKMTLPLIYALDQSTSGEVRAIKKIVRKSKKTKQDISDVLSFIQSKGGMEYAKQQMFRFKQEALDIIASYPDSEYKQAIIAMIDYTISRDK